MNERPPLPVRVQVGYATADIGINTVETVLRLWVLIYYTDVVGLSAFWAGIASALAVVWDAVTDPIMGVISDRTRHRFGGRRGYLPIGGVLLAIGVLAVFWPPELPNQATRFAWLLGSYCFLNTGLTVLSVPFMAMAGEMTEVPHERVVLFGWRFAFCNVGALLAALLPKLCGGAETTTAAAMPTISIVAALLVVVTAMCSWWATARVRFLMPPLQDTSLLRAFAVPFGNAAFRPLLLAYVVASTGIGINAATFSYYYKHVLELNAADTLDVLAVFMGVFTLSIVLWVQLSKRFGKIRPMVVGASTLGIGTTLLYLLAPVGGYVWVMGIGAIGLGGFVGSVVLIDTLLTDVLDHDFLRTRQLRSGLFFGVWRFASKMARALALVVVGSVLELAGFVEQSDAQPALVETALILLFAPGVGACFCGAAWILHRYRFHDAAQARVRSLLARREGRGGGAVAPAGVKSAGTVRRRD